MGIERQRDETEERVSSRALRRGDELQPDALLPRLRASSYQPARLDRRHPVGLPSSSSSSTLLSAFSDSEMATRLATRALLSRSATPRHSRLFLPATSRCMASTSGDSVRLQHRARVWRSWLNVSAQLRKTPLYDFHVANGAKMVPFAGYSMPLAYGNVGAGPSFTVFVSPILTCRSRKSPPCA